MPEKDYPTFRDLYEATERQDEKLEKVDTRVSRIEKAVIVLIVLTASPRLGGPSASQFVAALLGTA